MSVFNPQGTSEKAKLEQKEVYDILTNAGIRCTIGRYKFIVLAHRDMKRAYELCRYDYYYFMN